MIITGLRLHPFAFFADKRVAFGPGLNVVIGPNEAGKSTLFNAARSALLRTRLRKPEFEKNLGKFLPAGGGDTLRVEMEFESGAGKHILKRTWGPRPSSELVLPGGGALTDDEKIKEKLSSLLPARLGTVWHILMTGQSELDATAEVISREGAAVDLADVLRKTLQESGGVSADRFRIRMREEISTSDNHWDAEAERPEKNRGIENQWEKERGTVLEAFYARDTLKESLERARETENGLDALNAELRKTDAACAEAEGFLTLNRKAAEDARDRKALEARLEALGLEQEKLKKANREWPAAERRAADLDAVIAGFTSRRVPLEKEKKKAEAEEAGKALRERMERISHRQKLLSEARKKLEEAPAPDAGKLEALRDLWSRRAHPDAGSGVSLTITAFQPLDLTVREDDKTARKHRVKGGESAGFHAVQRLRITSAEMEIEAAPAATRGGDAAADERETAKLLSELAVPGLKEAEEQQRAAALLASEARLAARYLEEELAGDSVADLEKKLAALGPAGASRGPAAVEADLARLDVERQAAGRERKDISDRLAEWTAAYETHEKLLDALTDARAREAELRKKLQSASPLPEGFEDADSFLREYEKKREAQKTGMERRSALLVKKAEMESRAPESGSAELEEELGEAERLFQAARKRSLALHRIQTLTETLLSSSDEAVFTEMQKDLEALIGAMTRGRYAAVEMEGTVPYALKAVDGRRLGWEMMSAGTRDVLALALRLAMASHFIGKKGGFLMMDDPLVDMDPERQAAAAAALREFAAGRQLIVFTCHPASAELLGGNRIILQ